MSPYIEVEEPMPCIPCTLYSPFIRLAIGTLMAVMLVAAAGCDSSGTDTTVTVPPDATEDAPVFASGEYPMSVKSENEGPLYARARSELAVDIPFVSPDSLILVSDSVETIGPTISVVPTTQEIELSAYELQPDGSRTFLQMRSLPVIDIPRPSLDVLVGGRQIDVRRGLSASRVVSAEVVAESDDSVALTHPDDALYRVSEVDVTAVRGSTELLTQRSLGGIIDLTAFRSVVEPDDVLVVEINDVRRRNADGNIYSVAVSRLERVIVIRII